MHYLFSYRLFTIINLNLSNNGFINTLFKNSEASNFKNSTKSLRSTSTNSLSSSSSKLSSSSHETLTLEEQTKRFKNLEYLKENYTNTKTREAKQSFLNELNVLIASSNESNKVSNIQKKKQRQSSKKNNEQNIPNSSVEVQATFKTDETANKAKNKNFISFLSILSNIRRKRSSDSKQPADRTSRKQALIKPDHNLEMVRESPSKNSKNVSFRASSLMTKTVNNGHMKQTVSQRSYDECQQRFYRSLSPSKSTYESYASVIGQEPVSNKKNPYFAQAIGQSNHLINGNKPSFSKNHSGLRNGPSTDSGRFIEIHTSPIRKEISKFNKFDCLTI